MTWKAAGPDLDDEALLIAVANTGHHSPDEFADPSAVRSWWRGLGAWPHAGQRPPSEESVAMLRSLRAVIRALVLRNNGIDTNIDAEIDLAGLDGLCLRPDLRTFPSLRAAGSDDLGSEICAAAVTALIRATARPGWARFKACRGDDCRWVFVDRSRNSSRRWCDMAVCGTRAKSASFRARHALGTTRTEGGVTEGYIVTPDVTP